MSVQRINTHVCLILLALVVQLAHLTQRGLCLVLEKGVMQNLQGHDQQLKACEGRAVPLHCSRGEQSWSSQFNLPIRGWQSMTDNGRGCFVYLVVNVQLAHLGLHALPLLLLQLLLLLLVLQREWVRTVSRHPLSAPSKETPQSPDWNSRSAAAGGGHAAQGTGKQQSIRVRSRLMTPDRTKGQCKERRP